jgi:predicted XRE-type DNA-binding protein
MTTVAPQQRTRQAMEASAFKLASPIILALQECEPALRDAAMELFGQLQSDLDQEAIQATTALIAEILFPHGDALGSLGLDLEEAETIARNTKPKAAKVLARMDEQEATFAQKLRELLDQRGMTQAELATKIGVGQPAISMMLQRACRPQRKTIDKIAAALEVPMTQLWAESPG